MWLRRFAAPRPVGPAPMTRTSTLLRTAVSRLKAESRRRGGGEDVHLFLAHVESGCALQDFLETGDSLEGVAGQVQHANELRSGGLLTVRERWRGGHGGVSGGEIMAQYG